MGHLRDRFDADLRLAGRSKSTRACYLRCARTFVKYYMKPADVLGEKEVRAFLLFLIETRKVSVSYYVQHVAALRFLYRVSLRKPEVVAGIPFPRIPRSRPNVMTRDEVRRVIEATKSPFWRTFFATGYASGLRRMEVAQLRVEHIDADSGLIRVVGGKGGKDREVMLDPMLLAALRRHWRAQGLPGPWLFPARGARGGKWQDRPVSLNMATKVFGVSRVASKVRRRFSLHGLRHAFATHLVEDGVDVQVVQVLLGHERIETTTRYTLVRTDRIRATASPLSQLWR